MDQLIQWLIPTEVNGYVLLILTVASFLGSMITASLGVGGGAFLIMVMAEFISPAVLIPLHGLVQLASNGTRAWLTRVSIDKSLVIAFAAGAGVASLIGGLSLTVLPLEVISWSIVIFILYSCWGKMPSVGLSSSKSGQFGGGLVTTYATLFAGATGPIVASWLRTDRMDRFYYTANFSSCMTIQHALKVVVFSFAGFSFANWFGVLCFMVIAGYIGTRVGLKLLGHLPETACKTAFKWVLTLLAVRMVYKLVFFESP